MREMRVLGSAEVLKRVLPKDLNVEITGGDTKIIWSSDNRDEVENARRTFNDLKAKGYAAFSVKKDGERGSQIREFDRDAEKLIMVPQLRGGI